jgi:hypothetical protein
MIKSVLLDFVDKAGVETGNLKAFYNLSGSVNTADPVDRDAFYKLTSGATNTKDTYVVYNQLLPTGSQLVPDSESNPLISTEGYPAVVASSSTTITGSGLFDGSCSLRVANAQLGDSWTCFFDFSGYDIDSDTLGLNQVMLSTMLSENSLSGFNFGINGSNRLYYEYISGGENNYFDEEGTERQLNVSPKFQRETQSLTNHLKNLNIVSLSKSKNGVEFSLHKPNEETESLKTLTPEYSGSNELLLGGMSPQFVTNNEIYDSYYTGFSGHINTFLLFNDYIPETSRNTIAQSFWSDSYTPETLETGESTHKEVTGVEVQNVLSGQGIVSYNMEQTGSYVNQAGQTVPLYGNVPVMGNVFQDVLVDLTSDVDVKSITGKYVPEKITEKNSYVNSIERVAGKIKFVDPLEEGEIYEIYSHDSFINTVATKADTLGGELNLQSFGVFEPANTFIDNPRAGEKFFAKIQSNDFTYRPDTLQPYFQLFRNGLYQQEVSGLYTVDSIFYLYNIQKKADVTSAYDGDYFIHDASAGVDGDKFIPNRIKNDRYFIALNSKEATWDAKEDNLIFDLASGAAITGEYDGEQKEFGGDYQGKDIYYNGQKLISGIHFKHGIDSNGDPAVYSQPDKLSSDQHAESLQVPIGAKFVFVPPASNFYTRATGTVGAGSELNEIAIDNIFFEQVWRNGRRMIPGVHYFKIPDNSLISSAESPSQKNNSFVLETQPNSIDVKISSEAENNNNKIFSLNSSDQKQNLFEKV